MAKVSIGELIETGVITAHKDGNYGSLYPRTSEFGEEGVPFLTAKVVSDDGRIDFKQASRLNYQKANQFSFGWIEKDDVLLSHNATVGRVALVPEIQEKMLVGTSLTYFRLDKERLLPTYLAAYMASKEFQDQLASVMSYSTRNQVPITIQRDLFIDAPCLSEQKFIGDAFESFLGKIELNLKTNETLEGIAKALFKSWFVDFDPVRVKAEGRPTGLPAEISDLFPDSFEDSELGEIPIGWSVCSIGELMTLERDSITPGETPEEIFDHYSIPAFDEGMVPAAESGESIKSSKYLISDSVFMISKLNPRSPRVWIPASAGKRRKICSTEFLVCRPKAPIGMPFAYHLSKSGSIAQRMSDMASGTSNSHQRVRPVDFTSLSTVRPADHLLDLFTNQISPLLRRSLVIREENQVLAQCRDALLPKLISGELRVPDAEKMLEEVGI